MITRFNRSGVVAMTVVLLSLGVAFALRWLPLGDPNVSATIGNRGGTARALTDAHRRLVTLRTISQIH